MPYPRLTLEGAALSATVTEPAKTQGWSSTLWRRQLDSYPSAGPRYAYLAITVLATIMLYYELYVGGSVSTILLPALLKWTSGNAEQRAEKAEEERKESERKEAAARAMA